MISPDFKSFKKLAQKGNLVAVSKSIPADLETPVSSFLKLAGKLPHAFLLESAEQEERVGRFSFIGLTPRLIIREENSHISAKGLKFNSKKIISPKIADHLKATMDNYQLANPDSLPAFCGGLVGFLSYENVQQFENIKLTNIKGPKVPDAIFFLCTDFLIFDHFRKTLSFVSLVDVSKKKNLQAIYRRALMTIETNIIKLSHPLPLSKKTQKPGKVKPKSNLSRAAFKAKVSKIKDYIRQGDCIQVVLSQRFSLQNKGDDFQIYRALRSINPSPYMFYFKSGDFRLIGSSPELLVKKTGRLAEVRPIAGTRPRGTTLSEDAGFAESLRKSTKEMAEHLMLVDLGRNDLGRVCEFDSVQVKNFARIERYSHVMHLVSDVTGKLKKGKDAFDLLKATFPAGTVSGAPKVRAMQIIHELEPEKRGPYAGSLGYFSFNHDMDMCITIRTLVVKGSTLYLQAGAGIVKDSNPEREYQESVNKSKALLKALTMRGDF